MHQVGYLQRLKMLIKMDVYLNDDCICKASCHERMKVFYLWVFDGQIGSSAYWPQNCKS